MKKLFPVLFVILLTFSGCVVYQAPAPTPAIAMQTATPEPTPEPKVFSYSEFVDNLPLNDYGKNKTLGRYSFKLTDMETCTVEFFMEAENDSLRSIETQGLTHAGYEEAFFNRTVEFHNGFSFDTDFDEKEYREENKEDAKREADKEQAFFASSIEEVFSAMQKADFITKKEEVELFNSFADAYESEESATAQVGPIYASYTIVGDTVKVTIVFDE